MVSMMRSFLKEKEMPSIFWREALRPSIYVLNRLPTRGLTGGTPYEAWTKEKPCINHIRIFGCLTHMKISAVHVSKLDDRSKTMVYLGKEPGSKAHRLYDPNTRTLHVSCDVVFEEKKSWDWKL